MEKTYQHNVAVIALATEGIQRGVDRNIRKISGEIRTKRTSENVKLQKWNEQMGCGNIPVDYSRVQSIVDSLKESMGKCFDVGYAQTMIAVLQQDVQSNELGMQRSTIPAIRNHARVSARNANNEVCRLQRWVDQKGSMVASQ